MAAGVETAATIASIIGSVEDILGSLGIGGGDKKAKQREAMRKELQKLGFNWHRTKGAKPEDNDNIEGFGMQSLKNVFQAHITYGDWAVKAHNAGKMTNVNTGNYQELATLIENYRASQTGNLGGFLDGLTGLTGGNDPNYQNEIKSIFSPKNLVLGAGAFIVLYLINQ